VQATCKPYLQIQMNIKAKAGLTAATLAAATAFIVSWEGNKMKPYKDMAGIDTACAGVTKGIDFSKIYTAKECAEMNATQIQIHAQEVLACVKRDVTQDEQVALVSLAYNAGSSAICKSTLMRKLNANESYCDEYLRWNLVNGKPVRGLTNRRTAERALCIRGTQQ
jgi:lysozyme